MKIGLEIWDDILHELPFFVILIMLMLLEFYETDLSGINVFFYRVLTDGCQCVLHERF